MSKTRLYRVLADAFLAEGVRRIFALMGDGNMHWVTAMAEAGVDVVYARHEHCACAMAIGHFSASGEPGVASVTCGPGFTQITTALVSAVRGGVPMVVFAGESPLGARWHNHAIDQAAIAAPTGSHYIRAHSSELMADFVNEAFFVARRDSRPAIIGVPYDLQQKLVDPPAFISRSLDRLPRINLITPTSEDISFITKELREAKHPIIVAGRGAIASDAGPVLETLAHNAGALLSTTLPARGMFDHNPFYLGVSGGFCTPVAAQLGAQADLLVAFGARLNQHTLDGGRMYPNARIIQIDRNPSGLRLASNMVRFVQADAKLAAQDCVKVLAATPRQDTGFRTEQTRKAIAAGWRDTVEFPTAEGELDPRRVVEHLDAIIPKDWDIVSGSGHSSYFYSQMKGRRPDRFHVIREFGAIGNAISIAVGVAAERGDGKVVLMEGDGGFIMHLQELETLARHGIKLLACIMNDGAYGAEIHKLRADGVSDAGAIFNRPDFERVAQAFGLGGARFYQLEPMSGALSTYMDSNSAHVWNIHISRDVVSPRMRTFNARKQSIS